MLDKISLQIIPLLLFGISIVQSYMQNHLKNQNTVLKNKSIIVMFIKKNYQRTCIVIIKYIIIYFNIYKIINFEQRTRILIML